MALLLQKPKIIFLVMVAIGNKSNLDGNLSILKSKTSQDNVDMLFAELFHLLILMKKMIKNK